MSTRSGKRIHGTVHENIAKLEDEVFVKNERKTRSRRLKENCDETLHISKKRHNYVSYPTDEEQNDYTTKIQPNGAFISSKASKTTLKEQDLNVSVKTVDEVDLGKIVRQTRRTKKLSENVPEEMPIVEIENVKSKKKNKKSKKKKVLQVDVKEVKAVEVPKKLKRRKAKTSGTLNEIPAEKASENLNKSNVSIDSFHSAAGSPIKSLSITETEKSKGLVGKSPRRASKRFKADSYEDNDGEDQGTNDTFDKQCKKVKLSKHKDEINDTQLRSDTEPLEKINKTFDMHEDPSEALNTTFEKETKRKRKSSIKNTTFDENDKVLKPSSATNTVNTPIKFEQSVTEKNNRRKSLRSTYEKIDTPTKAEELNTTYEKINGSQNKSRPKSLRSTFDKNTPLKEVNKLNSTFEKSNTPSKSSSTIEDNKGQRKSLRSTFDKTDTPSKKVNELNSTFEKDNNNSPSKANSTLERAKNRRTSTRLSVPADRQMLNTTFENPKGSLNVTVDKSENSKLNTTFDKSKDSQSLTINTTFEKKDSNQSTMNSTFDKEKLNSTYDKPENQSESDAKSSLISSDSASNLTFDKSDEISRISITSDDSRTENIVNTTPVLIESSMDESRVEESTPKDASQSSDLTITKPSATPLKREGTFTKDGPEVVSMSPKVNISVIKTPVKRMSLPSPGSTPFPFSKSSQKEKSMLNVTRSIEKSERRSSMVEAAPRATRVMFCSPVNNPVVLMQQGKKVIKSNLKGSNKSFIFDESVSETLRPAPRKRSYTHNDADDARAKRKRLADDQLQSVARLSRPRTSSATVKLSEPSTPSKKPITPLKTNTPNGKSDAKVGRTKLPNFAALHQKQFAKMESLDECQVRKAKRAKQLLTPTGALAIIEKSSPKAKVTATGTEPIQAAKEVLKKSDTDVIRKPDADIPNKTITEVTKKSLTEVAKKPDIPFKAPKVTLDSLRSGYTRFGFKMNLDVNPFSIPPKTDAKPKENKPNGLTRQPSQPSLAGATTGRREVAKQIVMRERSFTSLSDKRKEKRTTIKGVRTNRRFELQMKLRNINS